MRINSVGIRSGEQISSAPGAKQNLGSILQIRGFYPPRREERTETTIRDELNQFSFFRPLTVEERREWFDQNSVVTSDLYLEDVPGLEVKFIKIGGKFFLDSLSQEQIDRLLAGNPNDPEGYWPIRQVYDLFPRKPGSKARKTTLIFRPGNWILLPSKEREKTFKGLYIDLDSFVFGSDQVEPDFVIQTDREPIGIIQKETSLKTPELEDLLEIAEYHEPRDLILSAMRIINWFPPSLHKSLIQKLIRTGAREVTHEGEVYSAKAMLLGSIISLILNPGSFVPDIQRYVTGTESAFKRIAVSICEDSSTREPRYVFGFFSCALMVQRDRNWTPALRHIQWLMDEAIAASQTNLCYVYDVHRDVPIVSNPNPRTERGYWEMSHRLLDEIRSFKSDINLVGSIAQNNGANREEGVLSLTTIPLIHCVDQHSFTEIGHFMPYNPNGYSEVFQRIWRMSSSVNPRRGYDRDFEAKIGDIRQAQLLTWKDQISQKFERETTGESFDFTYRLDESIVAGIVGTIEVKVGSSTAYVVLRTDDIYQMTVIKKPSREREFTEFTEGERTQARNVALQKLERGIVLNLPQTISGGRVTMVYREEEYLFNGKSLEEFLTLDYTLPLEKAIPLTIESAIQTTGRGIQESTDIDQLKRETPPEVLQRLAVYLSGYNRQIRLYKISRDGGSSEYTVSPIDTLVMSLLSKIAVLVPAALTKVKGGFEVNNGPLLWTIRDTLLGTIPRVHDRWPKFATDPRLAWEHQNSAVQSMIQRHERGKKGNLIWIPPGLGKTKIVLSYVDHLREIGHLPRFIVYSLPPSAVDSISREITIWNIPQVKIDMTVRGSHRRLQPYHVNIIVHDHMRLAEEELKTHAHETFFILDEFHKTLAKTKRTSVALEIAKLSYDFVGMSGTIIKDNNTEELIQWLEQIVDFEVTEDNYWVAVGALVSRKIQTNVAVERQIEEIVMSPVEEERYFSLVPEKLGGTASHIHLREAVQFCFNVITGHLVNLTVDYIRDGKGVFLVARDATHQQELKRRLILEGIPEKTIWLITKDTPITLTPDDPRDIRVVITTGKFAEGYTLTKFQIMITSVYFSNQATREQLEHRINRIGQLSPSIIIHVLHTGILTYILEKYEQTRNLTQALKGFAREIGIEDIRDFN